MTMWTATTPRPAGDVSPAGFTPGTRQIGLSYLFSSSAKYTDAETGLLYYSRRYYQPSIGRWQSKDPLQEDGGMNLYVYVQNAPTFWLDPLGMDVYGPDTIFATDNTYPASQSEVFWTSSGKEVCWQVGGHLAINGEEHGATVSIYPTGESLTKNDSWVEADYGNGTLEGKGVTVTRPKHLTRGALTVHRQNFLVIISVYTSAFDWIIKDQFGDAIPAGVDVTEDVSVVSSKDAWFSSGAFPKHKTVQTGIYGDVNDVYKIDFYPYAGSTGFFKANQAITVGKNWKVDVPVTIYSNGSVSDSGSQDFILK